MNFIRFIIFQLNRVRHTFNVANSIFSLKTCDKYGKQKEGALIFFDPDFYLNTYIDVRASGIDPIYHYVANGWKEGRSPFRYFNVQAFSKAHPSLEALNVDLAEACIRLYGSYAWESHIECFGIASDLSLPVSFTSAERRRLRKKWTRYHHFFDAEFYLKEFPDTAATPAGAFMHYMHRGFSEDRQPRADFDGYYYRKANGLRRGQNPFRHCIESMEGGQKFPANVESRPGVQLFSKPLFAEDITIDSSNTAALQLSLCIHVHCFYVELFDEIVDRLQCLTLPFYLVVTVCNESDAEVVDNLLVDFNQRQNTHILVVENRGRDIAPFLIDASPIWRKSDLVLHLHTKKSPHITWGDNWRRYLFDQTIGYEPLLKGIIDQFQDRGDLGMMYPENFSMIKHFTEEEQNKDAIRYIAQKLRLECNFEALGAYAAGSMAFYRVKALASVLEYDALENLFGPEKGQLDGTAAHVLERLLPEMVRLNGFETQPYFLIDAEAAGLRTQRCGNDTKSRQAEQ
ncbi:hypothetical protein GOZ92_25885 [Agrobacterium vitis]|nr:hypothetical protein [Agrobacterium vitis]